MKYKLYAGVFALVAALVSNSCSDKKRAEIGLLETVDVTSPTVDSVTIYRTYPGYASANVTTDIVGRVNGLLTSKQYEAGDKVNKGQVLFTIEPTIYLDAADQARAQLSTAQSELDYATRQFQAMKIAMESNAVSQMDVIQAESNMQQAQAAVKNAEAALNTALTNLNYCRVTAPISGVVTASTTDVGNYINGENSPVTLATVYDVSSIVFDFAIEDTQYEKFLASRTADSGIKNYSHVELTFEQPPAHTYFANLFYTSPVVDRSTGTLLLKVRVDNPYGELSPGMYATINMPVSSIKDAILVKDASISTDQLGKYLYTVNDSGVVCYTPIEIGELFHDTLRVVTKGVSPKSRYVTSALLKVRDGMKVNPRQTN